MDLTTNYLGLTLNHPILPGASPLVDDLDKVKRFADAGAPGFCMHSLFEEQIVEDEVATANALEAHTHSFAEALSYLPEQSSFRLTPDRYLDRIRAIKETTGLPTIASLNGTTLGRWLDWAVLCEQAGADALELNLYRLVADPEESANEVESRSLEIVRHVTERLQIPVAVKVSPYYSALAHFARATVSSGAAGLVLFNRFYQADIDPEQLEVARTLELSHPYELRLRLRWLAILRDRVSCSLGASGGVHSATDVVKALMAGADAVQVVSAFLRYGPSKMVELHEELKRWLIEHEYDSLEQLRGSMSLSRAPDPSAYERANYVGVLSSWREMPGTEVAPNSGYP